MADCGSAAAKKSEARKTDPDDNRVRLVDFIGNLQEGNTEGELERVLQSVKDANKFARLLPDSHVSFFSDRTSHPDTLIVAVWVFCSLQWLDSASPVRSPPIGAAGDGVFGIRRLWLGFPIHHPTIGLLI